MARKHVRKILYEALKKNQGSFEVSAGTTQSRSAQNTVPDPDRRQDEKADKKVNEQFVTWLTRQASERGLEKKRISNRYLVAVILVLAVVLVILIVSRCDQPGGGEQRVLDPAAANSGTGEQKAENLSGPVESADDNVASGRPVVKKGQAQPGSEADHVIVIATCRDSARDLGPVKDYFAEKGIETEIGKRDSWYFLLTKERYQNPEKAGTDGYFELARIKKIGANYRTPIGYRNFGSRPFQDAYGEKVR